MCHTIPLAASVVTTVLWKKKKESKLWSLNLMLYGAVIFGLIDHIWHGELFLISGNIIKDLCLGVIITTGVFLGWLTTNAISKNVLKNPV